MPFFYSHLPHQHFFYDFIFVPKKVEMAYLTCGCPLTGQWQTEKMNPIKPEQSSRKPSLVLDLSTADKSHPILSGVTSFVGNAAEAVYSAGKVHESSIVIARYNDGTTLLVERIFDDQKFGKVVAFNTVGACQSLCEGYPPGWDEKSDGALIMANCLKYVSGYAK